MSEGGLMKRLLLLVVLLAGISAGLAVHYHQQAMRWREHTRRAEQTLHWQTQQLTALQHRQQQLALIDRNRTEELTRAYHHIDDLQRRTDAGHQRLLLHARCGALPDAQQSATARLADATRARLTDTAQRDYFTLRRRIEQTRQQIAGLQDYIRLTCRPLNEE